ncbi:MULTISPECIES: DNA replication/repair protein RecF [Flavobacteriaceae]|uniref:DNA replication and repair protein RecF n=2 Tax=Flavobacteriaceae TaxID=49546 RepID=A0A4Y8AWJ3_9FLAO|nr:MULTISPECIES: DNA replication and repair protein RecF [Flavobacteriaceae]TEW76861.1 DNA replication and repair protein RecF [Gramella jeungdoensis]GGK49419.1 DNA replication and repair protein RecF [Lutibacter litoralis]
MHLQKITLVNFKNFESQSFDFENKINCFVGNNGVGKTNLLDAIYYLSFAKSYFNPVAIQNIKHNQEFFMIQGEYLLDEKIDTVVCSLKRGNKKVLKRNGKVYEKFSDHIGHLPLVIISPADRDLIIEGSDIRRKFIDNVISQSDKDYLQIILKYNKVLAQRNSLLKYFAANRTFDALNLKVYDEQLKTYGTVIFKKRSVFLDAFIPIFRSRYQSISNSKEVVDMFYKSQLKDGDIVELLDKNLERDRVLQYTSVGIHKDDLIFEIDGYPVKKFGSQGQQKSYLIALKLAQFDFITSKSNIKPILLLDDIFDKLDDLRVEQLINLVNNDHFGQLFISDTHEERTEEVVKRTKQSYKIFKL